MSYEIAHGVVAWLRDRRVVAYGKNRYVFPEGVNAPIIVRIPDLKFVETVLHFQFHTDPICDPGTPVNKKVVGNLVGFTLVGLASGTTLTSTVVAVGV